MTKGKETDINAVTFDGTRKKERGREKRIMKRVTSLRARGRRRAHSRHFRTLPETRRSGWPRLGHRAKDREGLVVKVPSENVGQDSV